MPAGGESRVTSEDMVYGITDMSDAVRVSYLAGKMSQSSAGLSVSVRDAVA